MAMTITSAPDLRAYLVARRDIAQMQLDRATSPFGASDHYRGSLYGMIRGFEESIKAVDALIASAPASPPVELVPVPTPDAV